MSVCNVKLSQLTGDRIYDSHIKPCIHHEFIVTVSCYRFLKAL